MKSNRMKSGSSVPNLGFGPGKAEIDLLTHGVKAFISPVNMNRRMIFSVATGEHPKASGADRATIGNLSMNGNQPFILIYKIRPKTLSSKRYQ